MIWQHTEAITHVDARAGAMVDIVSTFWKRSTKRDQAQEGL